MTKHVKLGEKIRNNIEHWSKVKFRALEYLPRNRVTCFLIQSAHEVNQLLFRFKISRPRLSASNLYSKSSYFYLGGAFKLNNHPQDYFDSKPFTNKGPLPPEKEKEAKRAPVKPFKHSSPAKHIGGCKAGCFDSYPLHSYDSYTVKTAKKVTTNSSGKLFRAIPGPKSTPTTSILTKNVNTHVNKNNYRGMKNFIFT